MKSKSNILLFQRIIPGYRIPVFKKLHDKLGVIVCYGDASKGSSLASEANPDFTTEKLKRFFYKNTPTAMVQNPLPVLLKYRPKIVISEGSPSYLTLWLLLFYRMIFGYKIILWSHGVKYHQMKSPFGGLSGKLRLFLFNTADAVILYSGMRKQILTQYLKKPEKCFVAWNTLNTPALIGVYENLNKKGKEQIKKELGWENKFNMVYIGRLLKSKRLDILVNVFNLLTEDTNVALHIIGSGPEYDFVSEQAKQNSRIHVYGSVFDDQTTGKYLYGADLMMMPGYVGLSIVHSFAFGCPVVTCMGSNTEDSPPHSPEIEYLVDGYNGYVFENDPSVIAEKLSTIINSPEELKILSENALRTLKEKAPLSRMMEGFSNAIEYINNPSKN